ncbi:MAG: heme-binding domain-containing protein [Draconibacterium sp.]|nr:heme-binding domain-containing protein [Draconibacterium sp.]
MSNKRFYPIMLVVFLFVSFASSATNNPSEAKTVNMPDNVKAIIDKSCFGCHNTDSTNDKGKEKLNLSTFDTLTKNKMIASYRKMAETVEENEMPPAKFLEKNPDKKLTDAEKKILMDWANKEAKALMQ